MAEIQPDKAEVMQEPDKAQSVEEVRATRATDFSVKAASKDQIWAFSVLAIPFVQRLILEIEEILFFRTGMSFPRVFLFGTTIFHLYQNTVYQVFQYTRKPNDPPNKKSWSLMEIMWISSPHNVARFGLILVEWAMKMPGIDLVLIFFYPPMVGITRMCWKQSWGGKGKAYCAWYVFYAGSVIFGFSVAAAALPAIVPMMISVVETACFYFISIIYAHYKTNLAGIVLCCGSVALGLEAYRFVASLFVFQSFLTTGDFGAVALQVAINVFIQALVQTQAFTWVMTKCAAKMSKPAEDGEEPDDIYKVFAVCGQASRQLDLEIPLYYYAFVWGSTFVVPLMFTCLILAYLIVGGDPSFGEGFLLLASNWHWILMIFVFQESLVEIASIAVEKAIHSVDKEYTPRISFVSIINKVHEAYGWPCTITLVTTLGMNCFGAMSMFKFM